MCSQDHGAFAPRAQPSTRDHRINRRSRSLRARNLMACAPAPQVAHAHDGSTFGSLLRDRIPRNANAHCHRVVTNLAGAAECGTCDPGIIARLGSAALDCLSSNAPMFQHATFWSVIATLAISMSWVPCTGLGSTACLDRAPHAAPGLMGRMRCRLADDAAVDDRSLPASAITRTATSSRCRCARCACPPSMDGV